MMATITMVSTIVRSDRLPYIATSDCSSITVSGILVNESSDIHHRPWNTTLRSEKSN